MIFLYPIQGADASKVAVVGGFRRDFYYRSDIYIGGQHMATDLTYPDGTPLRPVGPATIAWAGSEIYAGNFVSIDLEGGFRATYRHLIAPAPVTIGQRVTPQDTIGHVGATGIYAGWSHLHFDLWNKEKKSPEAIFKNGWWAHDPELYLGQEEAMTQTEFNKMFAQAVKEALVYAYDEKTKQPVGTKHTVGAYLHQIRRLQVAVNALQARADAAGVKRGDTVTLTGKLA